MTTETMQASALAPVMLQSAEWVVDFSAPNSCSRLFPSDHSSTPSVTPRRPSATIGRKRNNRSTKFCNLDRDLKSKSKTDRVYLSLAKKLRRRRPSSSAVTPPRFRQRRGYPVGDYRHRLIMASSDFGGDSPTHYFYRSKLNHQRAYSDLISSPPLHFPKAHTVIPAFFSTLDHLLLRRCRRRRRRLRHRHLRRPRFLIYCYPRSTRNFEISASASDAAVVASAAAPAGSNNAVELSETTSNVRTNAVTAANPASDNVANVADATANASVKTINDEPTNREKLKDNRKGVPRSVNKSLFSSTLLYFVLFWIATFLATSVDAQFRDFRDPCKDSSQTNIEQQVQRAAVVMTGTVQRLHRAPGRREYMGDVVIKRIIKGTKQDLEVGADRNVVQVTNFNSARLCRGRVAARDTKIFFFNAPLIPGRLALNSSVLRINLFNLFKVQAVVDGTPFTPPKVTPAKKCDIKYCAFGANCVYDEKREAAECVCNYECSTVFTPVCGSDNATYENECALRKTRCKQQRRILLRHRGGCNVRDPCAEKDCGFGARCESSLDGKSARCVCPEECKSMGDAAANPVCGNDGVDYPNVCQLKRSACLNHREIHVKYLGKCDPCAGHDCGADRVCQLNEYRRPTCRCRSDCTGTGSDADAVCGSDGRSYPDECRLRVAACRRRREIRVISRGKCASWNNPCHEIRCHVGAECHVDRNRMEQCICPPSCEPVLRHVCGTDGNTYDNQCELERARCITKDEIRIAAQGPCGVADPCAHHVCEFGATCVVGVDGRLGCDCPTCSDEFAPVCGDDGLSYTNICKLKLENCEQQKSVGVAHDGLCNKCHDVKCDFYAICEARGAGEAPECVCPSSCVQVDAFVCGSDGVTYVNECELRVASCKQQSKIVVVSQGRCDACANIRCGYGAVCKDGICECPACDPSSPSSSSLDPLCGSDGRTYASQCEMRHAACVALKRVVLLHPGRCEDDPDIIEEVEASGSGDGGGDSGVFGSGDGADGVDDEDNYVCDDDNCRFGGICERRRGRVACTCDFDCIENFGRRVCGTDGRVHRSSCHMRERSCRRQREIVEQDMALCRRAGDEDDEDGDDEDGAPPTPKPPFRADCAASRFGCCPEDGLTPARGPSGAGCPRHCGCNKLGAYDATCDPSTRQCSCKPGVGGLQCDRCRPGFWGLPKIAEGNTGCAPCACNLFGSQRDDCEQMTGRCVCKPGVTGMKCGRCQNGRPLTSEGCDGVVDPFYGASGIGARGVPATSAPRSCSFLKCPYGARCQVVGAKAECVCEGLCKGEEDDKRMVCGTDGETYGSECTLRTFACRLQKSIAIAYEGKCKDSGDDEDYFGWRRKRRRS